MRFLYFPAAMFVLLLFSLCPATGQGLTGQLAGTVVDASGAVVGGAEVTVSNSLTGQTRTAKTNDEGYFVFTKLLPGTYSIAVNMSGFKKAEQKAITLASSERVTLPTIALEVGSLTETVAVTAEAVRIQTES